MTVTLGSRDNGPLGQLKLILAIGMVFVLILFGLALDSASGVEVDGFTEPYRTIHVAASETGIITKIHVREGDVVEEGQLLAQLDDDVHLALLAIAGQAMNAKGRLDTTLADLELKSSRYEKLKQLRADGHARQEEVDRAATELAVAEGQVVTAREDLLIKKLEFDKLQTQLERRSIRCTADGVVAALHKNEGEFVAPNDPEVLTLVELDPLIAVFSIMHPLADRLKVHSTIKVRFPESKDTVKGTIEFISPVTDFESGTVRVKIRVDNSDGRYRSGERCVIDIPPSKQRKKS